jgi:hypothetical protein
MGAMRRVVGPLLAVTLLAAAPARAGIEDAGTTAASFLSLGAGPRTLAMGGAVLGVGDDAGAAAWNAAALGWVQGTDAALAHASLPGGSLQEWGTVGARIGGSGTRWGLSGLYQGDGSFQGLDASGAPTGDFSVSSVAVGATLAQSLGSVASLGVGAKAVHDKIATASGTGVTFDAGLMLRAGGFGLGVAAQNVGGQMSYSGTRYPFPTSYGVGVGYTHPASGIRVAVDANFPNAYHPDVRSGIEWLYRGTMALRAGYRHELGSNADPLTGPTFGLGAHYGGMWLDYGYLLAGEGNGQHRMGLRFHFGGGAGEETTADQKPDKSKGSEKPKKPEKPGDFDWARDGQRLAPTKKP